MVARLQSFLSASSQPAATVVSTSAPQAPERPVAEAIQATPREVDDNGLSELLLEAFQIESSEHFGSIREFLGTCPAYDVDALNEAYRCAHSLKGAARACSLRAIERLAHRTEALFAAARDDGIPLDGPVLSAIGRALDVMEDCGLEDKDPDSVAGCTELLAELERLRAGVEVQPSAESSVDSRSGAGTVETVGRTVASAPTVEPIAPDEPFQAEDVPTPTRPQRAPRKSQGVDTVRVHAEDLDRILHSTGQVLGECREQTRLEANVRGLGSRLLVLQKEWEFLRRSLGRHIHSLGGDSVLSGVGKYLDLQDREIRLLRRETTELMQAQKRSVSSLRVLGHQLQNSVRRARMVPVEAVFQGFRKMVRDLARDDGKEVEFRARGLQVFVDRMVLQALKDPVMHMLRNAIAHGLEEPSVREANGKPRVGTLGLTAEVIGDRLQLSLDDDGRGINFDDIRKKAVASGVAAEKAAALATKDLVGYIFQAGFSTARSVSDLSGRGMGLSVVHESVTSLQGGVTLQEKDGPGTCFVISVPVSFATHRLVVARLHDQVFAFPAHAVERLVRVPLSHARKIGGRLTISLEDRVVPVVSLAQLLELGEQVVCAEDDLLSVVVVSTGTQRVALAVDALLDQRDAVIQRLDPPAGWNRRLAGVVHLEDCGLVLVLNPSDLVERSSAFDCVDSFKSRASVPAAPEIPTVLVVDDSSTTRTLETGILETHGYRVVVAADGIEGLKKLRAHDIDVVVTDVEMPKMDGFGLVAAIKKDPVLGATPIIMVSSLHKVETQQRGLDLGADAYIVKSRFDHQDLLDTVKQLL
ncbi:MAG: hypothetical protein CMJ48_13175 [Planctomycetaceae bacterium]|nr:hypothetical protein [Planctomycetaceae bacterium]